MRLAGVVALLKIGLLVAGAALAVSGVARSIPAPAPLIAPDGEPGDYINFRTSGNTVKFSGQNGWVLVTVCTPDIIRVQTGPLTLETPADNILVNRTVWKAVPFTLEDLGDRMEIRTGAVEVDIHKRPLRVDFYDALSHPLSLERRSVHWAAGETDDVRACEPDEQFYGFGLQFYSFDQRGKDRLLKTNADPRSDTGESHVVVPFFMSTAGYGIFVDTTGYSRFKMGTEDPSSLSFHAPDPVLDYYFVEGPSLRDIYARYSLITGRMRMPPRWSLGFWYRMKADFDAAAVEKTAEEFRTRNIPCDVIGLEPGWQTHAYPCSFMWNPQRFPDPTGFMQWMQDHGFHLNLWEHAYTVSDSPLAGALKEAQVAADRTVWGGTIPDFTLQKAKDLFGEYQQKQSPDPGVAGYKLDEDDGSDYTGGWFFPDDTHFPSGLVGAAMHNIFGYLYQRAIQELYDRQNKRTFLLSRGGYAGSQAYPVAAYSDFYGFREYLRAACNSGFTGVLWCPEVRQGGTNEEFIRRSEMAFFSPVAMINAWDNGVLPWSRGPETERIFRDYATLRMQLGAYLYDSFWEDHQYGTPVVRPLLMDYPREAAARTCDDEYMLGASILVAPVLDGLSRTVYLPPGRWTSIWTGEAQQGGRELNVDSPLDREPVFVKESAILPLTAVSDRSLPAQPVDIVAFPGSAPGSAVIYNDEGTTTRYLGGGHSEERIEMTGVDRGGLTITAHEPEGRFTWPQHWTTLEIHGLDSPPSVIRSNGKVLKQDESADQAANHGERRESQPTLTALANPTAGPLTPGWRYYPGLGVVRIRISTTRDQTVRLDGVRLQPAH